MKEVDEALARAYARTPAAAPRPGRAGPPGPHRPVPPAPISHSARELADRPDHPEARIETVGPGAASHQATELLWPPVVLRLEQDWGDRFDRMAAALVAARNEHHLRAILFTSCHRAEGRTTLVLTLARALARHPGRTVVVDADLTGPMLARLLGLRPEVGLDDVVEGGRSLDDALIDAPDDHLSVLPIRCPIGRPREFLASAGWTCTLARLRREFDLILLDGGPMFTGLSAAVLHRSVDAAVLVTHHGFTGERAIVRAREVLEAGGVPLLGMAETFV